MVIISINKMPADYSQPLTVSQTMEQNQPRDYQQICWVTGERR